MNCIGYARLHLRAMNCFARLDLSYVYACEMDPLAETDRSILTFDFSPHAYGRQEVSTADLALSVHTYVLVRVLRTNHRCDPVMPLADHPFRCVCSLHNGITRMLWEKVMKAQENTHIIFNLIEWRIDIFKPGTPRCWLSDVFNGQLTNKS